MNKSMHKALIKPLFIGLFAGSVLATLPACMNLGNVKGEQSAMMSAGQLARDLLVKSVEGVPSTVTGSASANTDGVNTKIPLPESLHKVASYARKFGFASYVDKIENSMNSAADKAMPVAKGVFLDAAKNMKIDDAKSILLGGDTAATEFFKRSSEAKLQAKMLPVIEEASAKAGVAKDYNALMDKIKWGAKLAGIQLPKELDLNKYISSKASDVIFKEVAKEETKIRKNPIGESQKLLQKALAYYTKQK